MNGGMEKLLAGTLVLIIVAVTLVNFTNATSQIPNVSTEITSLSEMIPTLIIASGIAVALGSVIFFLKRGDYV